MSEHETQTSSDRLYPETLARVKTERDELKVKLAEAEEQAVLRRAPMRAHIADLEAKLAEAGKHSANMEAVRDELSDDLGEMRNERDELGERLAEAEEVNAQLRAWTESAEKAEAILKGEIAELEVRLAEADEFCRVIGRGSAAVITRLTEERDFAVAHDRQPYPTADAYERVCKARDKWQERADKAETSCAAYRDALEQAATQARACRRTCCKEPCTTLSTRTDTLSIIQRALATHPAGAGMLETVKAAEREADNHAASSRETDEKGNRCCSCELCEAVRKKRGQ